MKYSQQQKININYIQRRIMHKLTGKTNNSTETWAKNIIIQRKKNPNS